MKAQPKRAAGRKTPPAAADSGDAEPQTPDVVLTAAGAQPAGPRDPLTFLEDVLNLPNAPLKDRIRAAIAAAQYRHTKLHDGGKKDAKDDAAKKAAGGRFAPKAPPKLVVNNQ